MSEYKRLPGDTKRLLKMMEFVFSFMVMVSRYIHMSTLINFNNLNMFCLLHVTYTSVKLFKKKKKRHDFPLKF